MIIYISEWLWEEAEELELECNRWSKWSMLKCYFQISRLRIGDK